MEQVILVDEQDNEIGLMEKMEAHQKALLHRAFSVFIFNSKGEMLLHQRSLKKYHCGGLWTNACCSHPRKGETILEAANRRLKEEMGMETSLTEIFSFTYKAAFDNGLTEHEFDHVLIGYYDGEAKPDHDEVEAYTWESMNKIEASAANEATIYTPWFLIAFPKVHEWFKQKNKAA
jgi:isopentenyl-diphosphate delta-isomerase